MLFARTYRYDTTLTIAEVKSRLIGKHIQVHGLDFEGSEKDHMVKIIPHAEQIENIKTLPITHVELDGSGNRTRIKITSKIRKIDKGGPLLIVTFCAFMLAAAVVLFIVGGDNIPEYLPMIFGGIALLIFIIFWFRMESGYFDYVRKLRDYIKKQTIA